jgi:hypothetical protein
MTPRDLACANYLNAQKAPTREWAITMYFYAALHAVGHAASKKGKSKATFMEHQGRSSWVATNLASVRFEYETLMGMSHTARYYPDGHPMSEEELDAAREYAGNVLKAAGIPTT